MSKTKTIWRFKTKNEMLMSGGFKNWNDEGYMDYLFGSYLPQEYELFAEKEVNFNIPNTDKASKELGKSVWEILPKDHLVKESFETEKSMQTLTEALLPSDESKSHQEVPVFDIDRLAEEIDGLFQNQLKERTDQLVDFSEAISTSTLADIRTKADVLVNDYEQEVEKIFPTIKDRLIEEFRKGRTNIVLSDKKEIIVDAMDHPVFEEVMLNMLEQKKAMLVGPAG